MTVLDGANLNCSEFGKSFYGQFVFLVEVRGDDEVSVFVETLQGLVKYAGPDRFVVPEILMAEEGNVGGAGFGEVQEFVAPMDDEVGFGFFFEGFFPAGVGLINFGGADIKPLQVGRVRFFGEDFGENTRFVAPAASQVKQSEMVLGLNVRGDEITQISLKAGEVLLKEIAKWSVGHGRTLI